MEVKPKQPTDADYDSDEPPGLVPFKSKNTKNSTAKSGGRLAITDGLDDDSDGSMPSLQTVSDSSEEESDYNSEFEDDDDSEEDSEEEPDSEYDTDDEDQLREMFREAMDTAAATPDFFDPRALAADFDALAQERKGNPFIKLLGSLRGKQILDVVSLWCLTFYV